MVLGQVGRQPCKCWPGMDGGGGLFQHTVPVNEDSTGTNFILFISFFCREPEQDYTRGPPLCP